MRSLKQKLIVEFEALTKQEIKNYNDSLLHTHKSLNEFNEKLSTAIEYYSSQVAKLTSDIVNIKSSLSSFQDTFTKVLEEQRKLFSDINKLSNDVHQNKKLVKSQFDQSNTKSNTLEQRFNVLETQTYRSIDILQNHIGSLSVQCETMYQKSKTDNNILKDEILAQPYSTKEDVKRLKEESDKAHIEKDQLLKEIMLYKKKLFIAEKTIEDIFTRLKSLSKENTR